MDTKKAKSRRLLCVEDDPDQLALLTRLLEMRGYTVTGAKNVREAVAALRENDFDRVVTDYNLPDGTANDFAAMLPVGKTILLTARYDFDFPDHAVYLQKPVEITTLFEQLGEMGGVGVVASEATDDDSPDVGELAPLILYVTSGSVVCRMAERNTRKWLAANGHEDDQLEVVDLHEAPERGDEDRIILTPTLVRRNPRPRAWIVGDLSDTSTLDAFLG